MMTGGDDIQRYEEKYFDVLIDKFLQRYQDEWNDFVEQDYSDFCAMKFDMDYYEWLETQR